MKPGNSETPQAQTTPSAPESESAPAPVRRHRVWRWVFRLIAVGCLLLAIAFVVLHLALPSIVRQQVHDALAGAGYPNASFTVEEASLWGARLANVKAGRENELTVSSVRVRYRPLRVIFGKISFVRLENAAIQIDLAKAPTEPEATTKPFDFFAVTSFQGIPIWRVDLAACDVTLRRGADSDERVTVRVDGWLWREWPDRLRISVKLAGASGSPAAIDGSIDFGKRWIDLSARGGDLRLTGLLPIMPATITSALDQADGKVDLRGHFRFEKGKPSAEASIELRDGKFITTEEVGDLRIEGATASLDFTSLIPPRTNPGQHISIDRVRVGPPQTPGETDDQTNQPNPSPDGNELRDVQLAFGLDGERRFVITTLGARWGGGTLATADSVPVNLADGSTAFTLIAQHIGLDTFLKVVSQGRLSGQGSLSGRITMALNGSHVTIGNGEIRSDGPGMLNFGEQVSDMAGEIAGKDPRLRGQEEQLVAALTHFKYDEIVFEFRRVEQGLSIETRIRGRGTQGIKTPLDLTVHFQGLEQLLNTYLRATQRVQ